MTAALEFDLAGRTTDSSSKPVYIYGKSGRCWTFSDITKVEPYLKQLNPHPVSAEIGLWLIKKYGPDIVTRLSKMCSAVLNEDYNRIAYRYVYKARDAESQRQIISEPLDHELCIKTKDGKLIKENPTKWKHTIIPANMIVYSKHSSLYVSDSDFIVNIYIQDFFNDPCNSKYVSARYIEECSFSKVAFSCKNDLLVDYLTGDRIVYSSPKTSPVVNTWNWNPLRFLGRGRPTSEEFSPLIINIS